MTEFIKTGFEIIVDHYCVQQCLKSFNKKIFTFDEQSNSFLKHNLFIYLIKTVISIQVIENHLFTFTCCESSNIFLLNALNIVAQKQLKPNFEKTNFKNMNSDIFN